MDVFWLVAQLLLGAVVVGLAVLLVGSLRAWAVCTWRLEQVEQLQAISRHRRGLPPGSRAPAVTWRSAAGSKSARKALAARHVLLVFTAGSRQTVAPLLPELERLHRQGGVQVILVEKGAGAVPSSLTPPELWRAPLPVY